MDNKNLYALSERENNDPELSEDTVVRAINRSDGDTVWKNNVSGLYTRSPSVSNGRVYVGGGVANTTPVDDDSNTRYDTGLLQSLNASTGKKQWRFEFECNDCTPPMLSSLAVTDKRVYFATDTEKLYGLNSTSGQKDWEYGPEKQRIIYIGFTVVDGAIYLVSRGTPKEGGSTDVLRSIDAETGEVLWKFKQVPVLNWPVAVHNNTVYVSGSMDVSSSGFDPKLYALTPDASDSGRPPLFALAGLLAVILSVAIFIRIQWYRE